MLLRLYKIATILAMPLIILLLFYRLYKKKEVKISERLGISSQVRPKGKVVWVHGVSVGEIISLIPFLSLFSGTNYTILLTSTTITSSKIAKARLPKNCIYQFCPIDNYFVVRKFLNHWKPNLAIFAESEFWPATLSETSKTCKVISLNTRISDKSFDTWAKLPRFCRQVLGKISVFMPQSLRDEQKLAALGFSNIKRVGNLKYSVPLLECNKQYTDDLRRSLSGKKVLLFSSSHKGEEELAVGIYKALKLIDSSLIMFLAPRHPIRGIEVSNLIAKNNLKLVLRSSGDPISRDTDFFIIDSMGELGTFYRISPITIMGGTFTDIGGHNLIEPAKIGSLVIMGPDFSNFKDVCSEFQNTNAAIFIKDQYECVNEIKKLWANETIYKKYRSNAAKMLKHKDAILTDSFKYIQENYL